ncbi:MAG: type II toxin-antitoxin system VapC family toxin [Gammaproteobacteria bacterium]|nr:type II toxin-antitoxin system VapC family toxin [Gammaproteobacteria bacterium]
MKALDTNVVVRFLVGDDQTQAQKVYSLFKEAEKNRHEFYISILVLIEVICVVESIYKIKRNELLASISDLTQMPIFQFEHYEAIQSFIIDAHGNNYDLSDLLIAHCADQKSASPVLTFDIKAAKHNFFELI